MKKTTFLITLYLLLINVSFAQAQTVSDGRYIIYSRYSGLAMDVEGLSTENGANVWQWEYLGATNQQFDITHISDGYYSIRPAHSGKSLDVYDFSMDAGGEIRQWEYWGGDNQLWYISDTGSGYYTITSKLSGLALDVWEWSVENGGDIRQWTGTGAINQQWSFVEVDSDSSDEGYTTIPLDQVRVTSGPFKNAQDVNETYLLNMEPDRLLMPYRREAGISTSVSSYPSWESEGLDGHIGGHYLTALALMYASTGDSEMLSRLNYMVDALEAVQNANGNGYIGGIPDGKTHWDEIAAGTVSASSFYLNDMWVPWYNLHKVYAGLRDAYIYGGNSKALTLLINLSDWAIDITTDLSDSQMQTMLDCEHGGMNEVFADVYTLTGEQKYLDLAYRFSHLTILEPLLSQEDDLTGKHANTQIPKVIGYERIGNLAGEDDWIAAADFFWKNVVNERSVSIGGNSVAEHFHDKGDFSSMVESVQGPETCNTYNMLKLSKALYRYNGDIKYIEYYEKALFNQILSSQHPEHGGLVYFTSMRPEHYRVYSKYDESMWCCVGSGMENHSKYGEMIYAEKDDDFFVNLFISSTIDWKDDISFTQSTDFPDSENTTITVDGSGTFALNIRYPGWVNSGSMTVTINGQSQSISAVPGEYVRLERSWSSGDVVYVTMPMHTSVEQLPDGLNYYSVLHGPIVLAEKTDPYPEETLDLIADDARMAHVASGQLARTDLATIFVCDGTDFLNGITAVSGESLTYNISNSVTSKDSEVTLIPFFRLHDSRYSVYFAQYTAEDWADIAEELAAEAEEEAALEAITLDKLQPGQQQPESDHYIEYEDSDTGIHLNRYWRDATGYFSYLLDPQGETDVSLRVTYFGNDTGRIFDIYIDDQYLATQSLTGGLGDVFFDVDYNIPESLNSDASTFRVKFQAQTDSIAGGVFYVRLIRNE